jgi:hypothetical protein
MHPPGRGLPPGVSRRLARPELHASRCSRGAKPACSLARARLLATAARRGRGWHFDRPDSAGSGRWARRRCHIPIRHARRCRQGGSGYRVPASSGLGVAHRRRVSPRGSLASTAGLWRCALPSSQPSPCTELVRLGTRARCSGAGRGNAGSTPPAGVRSTLRHTPRTSDPSPSRSYGRRVTRIPGCGSGGRRLPGRARRPAAASPWVLVLWQLVQSSWRASSRWSSRCSWWSTSPPVQRRPFQWEQVVPQFWQWPCSRARTCWPRRSQSLGSVARRGDWVAQVTAR